MQDITIRELIQANRTALANGTLLAETFEPDDDLVYWNGSRGCSIGVAMNDKVRERVSLDSSNINEMVRDGVVSFSGALEATTLARATQLVHDTWALSRSADLVSCDPGAVIAWEYIREAGIGDLVAEDKVDRPTFERWLSFLETKITEPA